MGDIYVLCPPYIKTGGTELSHQLVYMLNGYGKKAKVAYYYSEKNQYIHPAYSQYVSEYTLVDEIPDTIDNIIIIPEGMTEYLKKFNNAHIYIWWMSVDNYFNPLPLKMAYDNNGIDQVIKEIVKRVVRRKVSRCTPLNEMQNVELHLVQSKYAEEFLRKNGIQNIKYLADYVNDKYFELSVNVDISKKEDFVLYNPKKGKRFTKKLIKKCNDIKFVPIHNMTNDQVIDVMSKSKVYMDFGNHPGKDRMPREAAMLHCCIITGKKGSAKYEEDVSIPEKFKFDDESQSIAAIRKCILGLFSGYTEFDIEYNSYRKKIQSEKSQFDAQVREIFVNNE